MLSAYLHITKNYRESILEYVGISEHVRDETHEDKIIPDVWLRSAKIPADREGLGDKGFENTDKYFAWFNRIRTPRVLRKRDIKQYDPLELIQKGIYCKGRYTAEVAYSFLENMDALKDPVPYHNISILAYCLEWGHALINLQQPLRKPGSCSGLPLDYWS